MDGLADIDCGLNGIMPTTISHDGRYRPGTENDWPTMGIVSRYTEGARIPAAQAGGFS